MTLFEQMENKTSNKKKSGIIKKKILNPEIWGDMTYDEKQAYKIYEAFQRKTIKRGIKNKWLPSIYTKQCPNEERDGLRPADHIRQSKNWPYFFECWEIYSEDQFFDIGNFIDSIFRNMTSAEKIFPSQLRTKKIQTQYKDYRMKLKMSTTISTEKKMMQDIATTFKFIRNRASGSDIDSLWSFFHDIKEGMYISDGVLCTIQEMISPFYYTISKSFIKAYYNLDKDIQEEIISHQEFTHIQSLVKIKIPVYKFAKELFGDDII